MRLLLASVLTCALLLGAGAAALGWYGSHHHLPQQQMAAAQSAGSGCFLFLGDSRMVAAFDAAALHRALGRTGDDRCLAPLAIGATDVAGMYLTAREYLAAGPTPVAAVIGKVGDSLLGGAPVRPEEMTGNNAIHLVWSRPSDVYAEVPGFPGGSIAAFDAGLRFLAGRAMPLGRYQSLVSIRVQRIGAALTGSGGGVPQNRFGVLGDMASLEDTFRVRAQSNLAAALRGTDDDRYGRWFGRLIDLLRQRAVVPIVVELPTRAPYRAAVTTSAPAVAYQRWLAGQLAQQGGALIDLSAEPWVDDQLFIDELHLGGAGAALTSTALGSQLRSRFSSHGAAR